jgi:hypothetical protein
MSVRFGSVQAAEVFRDRRFIWKLLSVVILPVGVSVASACWRVLSYFLLPTHARVAAGKASGS